MLGWEYPPRFAGGLGKACRGFSQAVAKRGTQVFFVLPTFPDRISEPQLEVVGARECMIEAGWTDAEFQAARFTAGTPQVKKTTIHTSTTETLETIHSSAQLFPYGVAPDSPMPENIRKIFGQHVFATEESLPGGIKLKSSRMNDSQRVMGPAAEPAPTSTQGDKEIYGRNLWSEIERFCFSVRQLADSHEVDLVHAHDWMTFPAAFEFQRLTGAPVFLHVHATEYDRAGDSVSSEVFKIEREGFRRATHIFAVSRYTAGIIEKLYGISKRKISVLYNAPEEEIKTLVAAPDQPRESNVVFLGRLTFQKGPDHFLKAAALVAKADPKARFMVLGTGDLFDQMRSLAHRLGIEHRCTFTGFMAPSEVDQVLSRSKVLVMPSVSEPFGLVALEAIHCGVPVILSKQSGVREVLHRALQVDFWDHEKLADQILAALRLPDLSRQLVQEGMDQVRSLSWDQSAAKAISTYHKHIGHTYAQAVRGGHGH